MKRKIICGQTKCKLEPNKNMNSATDNELSGSIGASSTEYSVPMKSVKSVGEGIVKRRKKRSTGSPIKKIPRVARKKSKNADKKGGKSKKRASNKSNSKKNTSKRNRKQSKPKKK